MIRPGEIQKIAGKTHVRDTQIEKDYVISWILAGISVDEVLSTVLAFKGGTVLKKFYFEDYRFSEDIDFTLIESSMTPEQIKSAFENVLEYVKDEANINLSLVNFGIHSTGNINFYIQYVGPLGGSGDNKRVKVDISPNEMLCYPIEIRQMFDSYSDAPGCTIKCYSLDEVMAEKLRSIISRTQPRDYYDLWYLCEIEGMDMLYHKTEFESKARHKDLDPDSLKDNLEAKLPNFKARWEKSMKDQIFDLPPYGKVNRELSRHFKRFFES